MDKNKHLINTRLINGVGKASVAVVEFNSNVITGEFLEKLNEALTKRESFQSFEDGSNKICG